MGLNIFGSLPTITPGMSGPQAPIDLFVVSPPSGLDQRMTFIAKGDWKGVIAIEGSPDGVMWDVVAQFLLGNDADAQSGPQVELSPVVADAVVRYLRANIGASVNGTTTITYGAEQNCDCSEGGGICTINEIFQGRTEDEFLIDTADGEQIGWEDDRDLVNTRARLGLNFGIRGAVTVRSAGQAPANIRVRLYNLANPGTLAGATLLLSTTVAAPAVAAPLGTAIPLLAGNLAIADLVSGINILAMTTECLTADSTVSARALGFALTCAFDNR